MPNNVWTTHADGQTQVQNNVFIVVLDDAAEEKDVVRYIKVRLRAGLPIFAHHASHLGWWRTGGRDLRVRVRVIGNDGGQCKAGCPS